jgi:protein-disulfide isomerase
MSILKVPVTSIDHMRGQPAASVTLVEYGDYECPHCGRAHAIVQRVQRHFGDQLRFVFRHFPLTQIHPNAEPAAEAAEWAGAHERFWEMHNGLYDNQDQLGLPLLAILAGALGLPEAELRDTLQKRIFAPKVRRDFLSGVQSGVNGTPSFFINGRRYDGSWDFDNLIVAIDAVLPQGGPPAP